MTEKIYDLAIIGAGAAALSAGIYAGRSMLDTIIIEKDKIGGQTVTTSTIANYPGVKDATGPALIEEMREQAEIFGCEFITKEIVETKLVDDVKVLVDKNGQEIKAYAVIVATGTSRNKIGFPGEIEYTGRGIAYCSTCDGELFTGMDVFVLGGGFAAAEESVYLTRYAKKVHMIIREPDFTCAPATANLAKEHPNIEITYNTEVKEISGDGVLQKAIFVNNETGEESVFEASEEDGSFGMFVFAGSSPNTKLVKEQLELDGRGFVPTNDNMETNVEGVYAAGDLRVKELRQIVTATSDGAIAATKAQQYVEKLKEKLGIEVTVIAKPKETKKAQPKEVKKETSNQNTSGGWFPDAMKEQLKGIFGKLTKSVTLLHVLDASNPKSVELASFAKEFSSLSDKMIYRSVDKGEDVALEENIQLTRMPSLAILNENDEFTGIKFSGIPSGHELNSLVLAVYNVGSQGQEIDATVKERIEQLKVNKIEICVSLTCHLCPDVVAACQRIASINHNVTAEMIDTSLFPELKKEKKIMSVPAMIINGEKVVFGSKNMDEILKELEN
ncbi:FAD-dependent oxidoreductase [Vagococcus carniphilus]|uniref:FAD-dependent oxidoreductase n=1 Tax=Vagococcus carniphilus TaxID=218144 RepID=UPI00288E1BFE|nr:FAD-dependent oxidoreductase [Vagococcus carniphilus]MDT2832182.1 FAD-dependent oxidoreductase [Vagococcus carniphilus]MDT2838247.1 FAD-dependent oxidoreductase [Vagococcus carniphilus]MDT2853593.1 FAD-dependent oxidoreductase [Vagococcus carniphilus]